MQIQFHIFGYVCPAPPQQLVRLSSEVSLIRPGSGRVRGTAARTQSMVTTTHFASDMQAMFDNVE